MSTGVENAVSRFANGHSCSQSVLGAYCERLGLDEATAMKIGCAFSGGMGRMGLTCGVVTGAIAVIGLRYAAGDPLNKDAKEHTLARVREFAEQFKARNHGHLDCRDLLGCDLSTPEGQAEAKEKGLHKTICTQLVRDAAEILERLGVADR